MPESSYHHNGKYSPKAARKEAAHKYATGTPEYRQGIEEIGCAVWIVVIAICMIIFGLISYFSGADIAADWVK